MCIGPWCAPDWAAPRPEDAASNGVSLGGRDDDDSVRCLDTKSEELPPLRRLPVKLPVPLGQERIPVTVEDIFLTKVRYNITVLLPPWLIHPFLLAHSPIGVLMIGSTIHPTTKSRDETLIIGGGHLPGCATSRG
eukprot:1058889-Prorocentrum_minimum.AAC.3